MLCASLLSAPTTLIEEKQKVLKAQQYLKLLNCRDLKEGNWIGEKNGVQTWPPIFRPQIEEFVLSANNGTTLGKRLLSDYKEGKAYSYFDSRWLKEVLYHNISESHELCFLKSETLRSNKLNNINHKVWICVETVETAYCTCFAECVLGAEHCGLL